MTNASLTVVALRGKEIDSFLARPDAARPIILLYGPDAGLVRERAAALLASAVDDPNDPFSLVRLDGDALSAAPSRLVDEAMTVPLFGGRRAIRVRAGSRSFASGVDTFGDSPLKDWPPGVQDCCRDRLLSRRRARSCKIDRRRISGLEFAYRAGRARGIDGTARRRPPGLAQRAAQAGALCARRTRGDA